MPISVVTRYVGENNVPQDIRRRRRSVHDAMRRLGAPVLVKHMFNADDQISGVATYSPVFNDIYGQTRNEDPISYGVGFVSTENSTNEWIKPDGSGIVTASVSPGQGYQIAPKYRGFGPGYLTYVILPDVKEDVFKLNQVGALIKVQSAQAQAAWYPSMNDNDLLINVELDAQGNILKARERFLVKMSTPVTMRGLDRRGQREGTEHGGNQFMINNVFELSLLPEDSIIQQVEIDR